MLSARSIEELIFMEIDQMLIPPYPIDLTGIAVLQECGELKLGVRVYI